MAVKKYSGSCHCGVVKYEADIDLSLGTGKCNCTFCRKHHAWKAFIKPDAFRLLRGEEDLTMYQRHPQAAERFFCKHCGVMTHEKGDADYMGGPFAAVFLDTLDNVDEDELASAPVRFADGLENNWMNPPADTRNL